MVGSIHTGGSGPLRVGAPSRVRARGCQEQTRRFVSRRPEHGGSESSQEVLPAPGVRLIVHPTIAPSIRLLDRPHWLTFSAGGRTPGGRPAPIHFWSTENRGRPSDLQRARRQGPGHRGLAHVAGLEGSAGPDLLYPPGLDFIAAFFGCQYADVVAVPVYPPRMNRAPARIRRLPPMPARRWR